MDWVQEEQYKDNQCSIKPKNNLSDEAALKNFIAEKFPKLESAFSNNSNTQRIPVKIDTNKNTLRQFRIRKVKTIDRARIPKAEKSKMEITYEWANLIFIVELSKSNIPCQWENIVKISLK